MSTGINVDTIPDAEFEPWFRLLPGSAAYDDR